MTEREIKPIDPRGLRSGEFGDTATTLIGQPTPTGRPVAPIPGAPEPGGPCGEPRPTPPPTGQNR